MSTSLQRLLPLFEREVAIAAPVVLATLVRTAGPTYTKPGAQLLIARSGEYAGLLSGGCLEGDLSDRARRVLDSGRSELVRYDMRGPDDLLFGMGSGCEGALDILLQRLDSANDWQPLRGQAAAWRARRSVRLLLLAGTVRSREGPGSAPTPPGAPSDCAGAGLFVDNELVSAFGTLSVKTFKALQQLARALPSAHGSHLLTERCEGLDVLLLDQPAPVQVLLLGAGPDALPVARLAAFLGWCVTVIDHRSQYARMERFPDAEAVLDGGPAVVRSLTAGAEATPYAAAIIMSHHLRSDLEYLRALAGSAVPYVGLLGPAARRDRLLTDMDADEAERLRPRLRAPIGLDLGAASPESIALAIVAEIHANLAGAVSMRPLSALHSLSAAAVPV